MTAMPVMIAVLCVMAIAYRYYSAFLAAKVAVLDDKRVTPAHRFEDGQNYHPTNKWVLFGHHFAAISGAGPLIGPVLAAQFGYLPGLLWIVIGVCLGGAVQDFLVLSASLRRQGKSLAQIAFSDIGRVAGSAAMLSILFIVLVALAGLGKVVVKALGGEAVKYPAQSVLVYPQGHQKLDLDSAGHLIVPAGAKLTWDNGKESMSFSDSFTMSSKSGFVMEHGSIALPGDAMRLMPGSAWGTFTIFCTIPIALFIGLYMNKLRPGRIIEASIIGAVLTIGATVAGAWVAEHSIGQAFNLSASQVTWAMAIYGFVASVLPVWILLTPRDYLSSFLKLGTIALLVIGVIAANPRFDAPAINHVFLHGGPIVGGSIFPFLFIVIMCGAISGFHALVSSGTTPKMINRERDARVIGYGGMLMEGLVGVIAIIAASALPTQDFYAMNTELAKAPLFHDKILEVAGGGGVEHIGQYEALTKESLRGRTGGAVTLAVGMASIFDRAVSNVSHSGEAVMQKLWKYWYHFAIMFEALFILTTIDAGTRIGRFLLQEALGKVVHPRFAQANWWPGAIASTALIVLGWTYIILNAASFDAIWKMFGIANQMLAVIALAVVSVYLFNEGRGRYLWVTVIPMAVVMTTTSTAAMEVLGVQLDTIRVQANNALSLGNGVLVNAVLTSLLIVAMLGCTIIIIASGAAKVLGLGSGGGVRGQEVVASVAT
jgi:carbon starvation protein